MTSHDELIKDAEITIDAVKSKLALLTNNINTGIDSAAETTKHRISDTVQILAERQLELETRLQGLKSAAGNASEDLVIGVEMAWEDLKETASSIANRF